jgi:uncharacterized damage-inducible protein DinB
VVSDCCIAPGLDDADTACTAPACAAAAVVIEPRIPGPLELTIVTGRAMRLIRTFISNYRQPGLLKARGMPAKNVDKSLEYLYRHAIPFHPPYLYAPGLRFSITTSRWGFLREDGRAMIRPMRTLTITALVFCGLSLNAQSSDNPLSAANKAFYMLIRGNIAKAADKMPEESYSFKPTADVRSFGQLVGHVADASYMFCSLAAGEKNPSPGIEKTKTSKADLVKALNDALAYCDKTYDGMTDTAGLEKAKFFGREFPKLSILSFNVGHEYEHYGNMVTYMRLKGLVPPSSEPRPPQSGQ